MISFEPYRRRKEPKPKPSSQRAILPDAIDDSFFYLIKGCTSLRLTCEVRLASYLAKQSGRRLCLLLRPDTMFEEDLETFIADNLVRVERNLS